MATDGAYLLRSNQAGWTAREFWETYIQLTVVERAFRVLKSELLLRPIWHHYSGRTQAHVMVCVLAYALWKTLDHLAKRAGLMTEIRKPDRRRPRSSPKPRRMTPQVILRELATIKIGDILMKTTDGPAIGPASRRSTRAGAGANPGGSEADDAGAADHAGSHFVVKTRPLQMRDSLGNRSVSFTTCAT